MHLYIQAYDKLLSNYLKRMEGICSELPVEALGWKPAPTMNSLEVLVVHTTGALRYWVGELLGAEPAHRDREAEFDIHGLSKAELRAALNETQVQLSRVLEKLVPDALKAKYYFTIHEDCFTGAFALAHALEHTALHVGHMEITRDFWKRND